VQCTEVPVERLAAVHATTLVVYLATSEDDTATCEHAFLVGPAARPPDRLSDIERGVFGARDQQPTANTRVGLPNRTARLSNTREAGLGTFAGGVDDGDFGQVIDEIHLGELFRFLSVVLLVDAVPVNPEVADSKSKGKGDGILNRGRELGDVKTRGEERGRFVAPDVAQSCVRLT